MEVELDSRYESPSSSGRPPAYDDAEAEAQQVREKKEDFRDADIRYDDQQESPVGISVPGRKQIQEHFPISPSRCESNRIEIARQPLSLTESPGLKGNPSVFDEIETVLLKSKQDGNNLVLSSGADLDTVDGDYGMECFRRYDVSSSESRHTECTNADPDPSSEGIPPLGTNSTTESVATTDGVAITTAEEDTIMDSAARDMSPMLNECRVVISPNATNHSLPFDISASNKTSMSLPDFDTSTTTGSSEYYMNHGQEDEIGHIVSSEELTSTLLTQNKSNDTVISLPDVSITSSTADPAGPWADTNGKIASTTTTCSKVPPEQAACNELHFVGRKIREGQPLETPATTSAESEALSLPAGVTDTTDQDSDSSDETTPSEDFLLRTNLSDEVLYLYECDKVETFRLDDQNILKQIMPKQPEFCTGISNVEEEKMEVEGDYSEIGRMSFSKVPEPSLVSRTGQGVKKIEKEISTVKNRRPEFVSASILKLEEGLEHGLEFISIDGTLRVSNISDKGLLSNSPLRTMDRMLRINDLNCESLDPVNASHILGALTGHIVVIAQNIGGNSSLIESQITKPLRGSRIGISFKDICRDELLLKNEVEIATVEEKSLFTESLLHVGDRILSVNGCVDLDSTTVDVMLDTSPKHVTILAQTRIRAQMAIARRTTRPVPPEFNFVRASAAAQRQREQLQRKERCYYNICENPAAYAYMFQWAGNVYVITIVIVGIVISWSTVKQQTYDGSDAVGTIIKFGGLFVGGIILGFLVNAPWWFRRVGARFSIAQAVCNAIVIASFFILTRFFDSADIVQEYRLVIFFAMFFPLLIIVNLPTVFVKREDGSDGNTISEQSYEIDDVSSNSTRVSDSV